MEVNRGLPGPMLVKFFMRDGDAWKLKDSIRQMVEYRPLNLCQPWGMTETFDIVFMRNVLIYFDLETKKRVFQKLRNAMAPDAHLFLGAAETVMNIAPDFAGVSAHGTTTYQLKKKPH